MEQLELQRKRNLAFANARAKVSWCAATIHRSPCCGSCVEYGYGGISQFVSNYSLFVLLVRACSRTHPHRQHSSAARWVFCSHCVVVSQAHDPNAGFSMQRKIEMAIERRAASRSRGAGNRSGSRGPVVDDSDDDDEDAPVPTSGRHRSGPAFRVRVRASVCACACTATAVVLARCCGVHSTLLL